MSARLLRFVACAAFVLCPAMTSAPSSDQKKGLAYDVVVYGGTSRGRDRRRAGQEDGQVGRSSSARTSTWAACPAAGWASPTPATRRSSAGWSREFYHRVWTALPTAATRGSGRSGRSTATRARARRRSTATSGRCGSSSRTWPSRCSRTASREFEIPVHRDEWLDREARRREDGGPHRLDHDAQRQDLRGADVHRRHLRGRPDGRGGRRATTSAARRTSVYGEKWNGVQTGVLHHGHHFGAVKDPISPYVVPGDPASGLLPRISTEPPGEYGRATSGCRPTASACA